MAERALCKKRRDRFIQNHLWIQNKDGVIQKFSPLKRFQRRIFNLIQYIRTVQKKPVRIIILKTRKIGNSTFFVAEMYAEMRDKGINGLIIAHDDKTSKLLLRMAHLMYEREAMYDKPALARGSINEIVFEGHKGKITIETANNIKAGTGDTLQYLVASECSKWAKGEETAGTLMQAVAKRPSTTVILESTAFGFDPYFQPTWKLAYDNCRVEFDDNDQPTMTVHNPDEWNGYVPVFFSPLIDPDCRLEFDSQEERDRIESRLTDDERHLVEYGADIGGQIVKAPLEYINFARWTRKNECGGSEELYNQEYPKSPEVAFRSTGNPVFNRSLIYQMPIEAGRKGRLHLDKTGWSEKIRFAEDSMGPLTVFRAPIQGHRYVVTLDTAEGLRDDQGRNPDATVCDVYDLDNGGEQVAVLAGQISPTEVMDPWWLLMRWYNMAFGVPERNNTGEYPCLTITRPPYSYPEDRLYHMEHVDKRGGIARRGVGWKTNVATRNNLIDTLSEFMEAGQIRFHSIKTQEELLHFVTRAGRRQADVGFHDDHVITAGLACKGIQSYPVSLEYLRRQQQRMGGLAIGSANQANKKRPDIDGYGTRGDL